MENKRPAPLGAAAGWGAALAVTALLAAAFFLPEWLSGLHDRQLLDNPVITVLDGTQEGFAEAIQLTVAEKLLLLRSGGMTAMELGREMGEGIFLNFSNASEMSETETASPAPQEPGGREDAELRAYGEELSQLWETRLASVQVEIRNLQAMGGLPVLWNDKSEVFCSNLSEVLYMDPDTQMNFQVYRMTMYCESYQMGVTVDAQSGRILSLDLRWDWNGRWLTWGLQGASNFGAAWRNYWGMDSVGGGWYNEYNRNILEQMNGGGDYDAHGQISFTYDSQTILIPLDGWAYSGHTNSLSWNA